MTRALLVLVACCMGCATARPEATPRPPRIRCLAMGQVEATPWWVYVCTFEGEEADSVRMPPSITDAIAGGS